MKKIKATWSGAVAAILLSSIASGAVFPGTGTGAIPDTGQEGPGNWGTPLIISFEVNGLTGNIQDLSVSITMSHTYISDLDVFLTPPPGAGVGSFTLFSQVGSVLPLVTGSFARLAGTYQFSDSATGNLWKAAEVTMENLLTPVPSGAYRTSRRGGEALGG